MQGSWEGFCTSGTMVCILTHGSRRGVRRKWQGQKPLIFMRFHGVSLGNQHKIWSKQHNGKVSYERIKAGQPPILPGDGSEGHDYIYVGDVARATVMAMASEVTGESFVIVTGVDTSLNDIAQILLRLTGSSLQPVYQDQPGTVAATTKATLGYRPTKAKQLLGWEAQVGIEEGIRRLIAWAEGRSTP